MDFRLVKYIFIFVKKQVSRSVSRFAFREDEIQNLAERKVKFGIQREFFTSIDKQRTAISFQHIIYPCNNSPLTSLILYQADYNFGSSLQELAQNGCTTSVCVGTSAWSRYGERY